ncbi:MAG: methyl-accepting chemotaxis protein [Syntrophobacteraceae bacterium]
MNLKRIFGKSLKTKLLGSLLVITLIPIGVLNLISYMTMKSQIETDADLQLTGYARRVAKAIDIAMNERVGDVSSLSGMDTVVTAVDIGGGQAGANQLFQTVAKTYGAYDLLMLLNRSGNCIAANIPQAIGQAQGDQPWFKEGIAGRPFIGDFGNHALLKQLVPESKGWSMVIAAPVVVQNEVRGVMVNYVKWDFVNSIIASFPVGTTGYTYMVESTNMSIIGHPNKELIGTKLSDLNLSDVARFFSSQKQMGTISYLFNNPVTKKNIMRSVGYYKLEGFDKFSRQWLVACGADHDEIYAALPTQLKQSAAITAIFLTILIIGSLWLTRSITKPILSTANTMVAITEDLDFTRQLEVKGEDEISKMEHAFNTLLSKLRQTFGVIVDGNREVSNAVEHVMGISTRIVTNATEQSKRAQDVLGRIQTMGQTAADVQHNALESQRAYEDTTVSITSLTESIQEIAKSAQSQANMVEEARSIINVMGETAQQVAGRATKQSEAAEETSKAAAQMATSIHSVAERATQAGRQSEASYQAAADGRKAVEQVALGMQTIAESSEQITDIIEVISDIADQTNLLALNAAIEAARAGEHGRGFAVVAEEVRKLAERTAESTKEISVLIKNSGERVKEGTELAVSSKKALDNIFSAVEMTNSLIREIDSATKEQTKGIQQVASAMDQLRSLSQEITDMTGEQGKRRLRATNMMDEVFQLSQSVSGSTQEQVRSADQVMKEVVSASKFAQNITDMTTQQKERSQLLQQIVQDMSDTALKNAAGAQESQTSSEKLGDVMIEFGTLIAQFKIGKEDWSADPKSGNGRPQNGGNDRSEKTVASGNGGHAAAFQINRESTLMSETSKSRLNA